MKKISEEELQELRDSMKSLRGLSDCTAPWVCSECGFIDNEILASIEERIEERTMRCVNRCRCGETLQWEEFPVRLLGDFPLGSYYPPYQMEMSKNEDQGGA